MGPDPETQPHLPTLPGAAAPDAPFRVGVSTPPLTDLCGFQEVSVLSPSDVLGGNTSAHVKVSRVEKGGESGQS